jgi:hypothetical protein
VCTILAGDMRREWSKRRLSTVVPEHGAHAEQSRARAFKIRVCPDHTDDVAASSNRRGAIPSEKTVP